MLIFKVASRSAPAVPGASACHADGVQLALYFTFVRNYYIDELNNCERNMKTTKTRKSDENNATVAPEAKKTRETAQEGLLISQSIGYLIRDSYRGYLKVLGRLTRAESLTTPQWFFLRNLWEGDGVSQRELAARVGVAEQTAVAALRILERRDLLERNPDPRDSRRVIVRLTAKGWALKTKLLPFAALVNDIASAGMSRQQLDAVRNGLATIHNNLESHLRRKAPHASVSSRPSKKTRARKDARKR